MNMNNYCNTNYLHGVWVTVIKIFLDNIAKRFEMNNSVFSKLCHKIWVWFVQIFCILHEKSDFHLLPILFSILDSVFRFYWYWSTLLFQSLKNAHLSKLAALSFLFFKVLHNDVFATCCKSLAKTLTFGTYGFQHFAIANIDHLFFV